ncbi:MAG: 50S ribosomal protein L11 [Candidatus Magasanikbacteria bacterium]
MANKDVKTVLKMQIKAGEADAAPPIGPALGQHGVNIGDFVSQFNEQTADREGDLIPVEITVYKDRSFDFETKSPPASFLLKQAAGIEKAAAEPHKETVGTVTEEDLKKIAKKKMDGLNARDMDAAVKIIKGTAKNMGIEVE